MPPTQAAEPEKLSLKAVSDLATQPAVEDSVDALLRTCGDDPVTAMAAMAEAVWRRNGGKFAGADAVLYRTLQAQLSGKYRAVLEPPPGGSKSHGKTRKQGGRAVPDDSPYGGGAFKPRSKAGSSLSASSPKKAVGEQGDAPVHSEEVPAAGDSAESPLDPTAEEGAADSPPAASRRQKAQSTLSTRNSLRVRSISAPVPPRPAKARTAPIQPKSKMEGLQMDSPKKEPSRVRQAVDVNAWLMERKRKEREREEMRQARLKNDTRFIEKLDERQAERNKSLQEEQERIAQNVAGKKGQKWKPVPFTPWPEANKSQAEVVTEDAIFKKDVARLFGTVLDDKGVLASRVPTPKTSSAPV